MNIQIKKTKDIREMTYHEILHVKLRVLRRKGKDLDQMLGDMLESDQKDQMMVSRLRRQQRILKKRICFLEDVLIPDIIA